jgi:hypothetical protein
MSFLLVNKYTDFRMSLGKFYISTIIALIIGLFNIIMYDFYYGTFAMNYYIGLGIVISILIYFYKYQIGIEDNEYVKNVIEVSSNLELISDNIIDKTENNKIKNFAKNIIFQQLQNQNYLNKL